MNSTAAGNKGAYVPVPSTDASSLTGGTKKDGDMMSSILGDDRPKKGEDSYTIAKNMLLVVAPKSYVARRRLKYASIFVGAYLAAYGLVHVAVTSSRRGRGDGGRGALFFGYEGRTVPLDPPTAHAATVGLDAMAATGRSLTVSTWNIAAINNNPFEYWIHYPDDGGRYDALMAAVERFVETPGPHDVPVNLVFTDGMFDQLEKRLDGIGWDLEHKVRKMWRDDLRGRKIVSQFLKDPTLGSKRLASMPDRVTNTIHVDGQEEPACRPTVINGYTGDLSSVLQWWPQWEAFMFDVPLSVGGNAAVPAFAMLRPIQHSKYPDITTAEEKISLPLQVMCCAIFDAILVSMMNTVAETPESWQELKRTMVENLIQRKVPRTLEILESTYSRSDVVTLQEVSVSFIHQATQSNLAQTHHIVAPQNPDAVKDQNSVILLRKETFPHGSLSDITDLVMAAFPRDRDIPVSNGDLLVITAQDIDNVPYVIASFHGDTNGLATKPVLDALVRAMTVSSSDGGRLAAHELIFGLDANTYEHVAKPNKGKRQDVLDFGQRFAQHGLTSCWGDVPQPSNYTTFNARTYLQPQLNKACKSSEKREKGDVNPKDFILFKKQNNRRANNGLESVSTWKDNTGVGGGFHGELVGSAYVENVAFPTLRFPSDHGILSTELRPTFSSRTTSSSGASFSSEGDGGRRGYGDGDGAGEGGSGAASGLRVSAAGA